MLAQARAPTTAPSSRTALLVSVRRNWRSGVCRWRTHAVRSVKPGRRVPFIAQPRGRTSRLLEQPGDGAVLGDRPGRYVHVELALEGVRVDAQLVGVGAHVGERDPRRLIHHVAELAGQDQPLVAV